MIRKGMKEDWMTCNCGAPQALARSDAQPQQSALQFGFNFKGQQANLRHLCRTKLALLSPPSAKSRAMFFFGLEKGIESTWRSFPKLEKARTELAWGLNVA